MPKKPEPVQPKGSQIDEFGLSTQDYKDFFGWKPPRRKPRIYADMDVPKYVIDFAREKLKWDIVWTRDNPELVEQHDYYHFYQAKKLKRILLSYDEAFYSSSRFKLHETEGIIVFSVSGKSQMDSLITLVHVHNLLIFHLRRDPRAMRGVKIKAYKEGCNLTYLSKSSKKNTRFIRW